MKSILKPAFLAFALCALSAHAQSPNLNEIAPYKPEYRVAGGLRIAGSELKGNVELLVEGFKKFHPGAVVTTNFMTSSEGALGMMFSGASDVAPMGDDAKIPDQMPFYNTFRYVPTEISIATGGYDQRGTLFAWAIIVNKDNPIAKLSMDQLDRIFGSERTGGWEVGANADNNLLFTGSYARGPGTNIRQWSQLGLTGDWADKEIQTYGYVAPKEATADAAGSAVVSQRMYEALEKDRYGIGWGALMHVNGTCVNPDGSKCPGYRGLKVIALSKAADGPAIALTADNVRNRSYPLIRDAYIYVNKAPGRPMDPKVREFIRFVLSREGQEIIQKAGVYSALPASYIRDQLKKLD